MKLILNTIYSIWNIYCFGMNVMARKTDAVKQQAYDFYNSYKWPKVSWPTFYNRVRLGGEESWESKVKLKVPNQYRRREFTPRGKWAEQMIWYNQQPEPKASKTLFRNRLNGGYPKEEAILMGDDWNIAKEKRKPKQYQPPKPYIPKKVVQKEPDESDFKIEITLSKEEAMVFRKEYVRMIEQIEWELTYTDEKTQISEMNKKLDRLHKELDIFNKYNH